MLTLLDMMVLVHLQIDTAAAYTGRNSEKYLGEISMTDRGLVVSTKIHPNPDAAINHTPEVRSLKPSVRDTSKSASLE